jgi:hypothetical protein
MGVNYGSLPFKEQIAFFLAKTPVPTERWNDLQRDAHDSQFMVAGAMKADLLADLKAAMAKAGASDLRNQSPDVVPGRALAADSGSQTTPSIPYI